MRDKKLDNRVEKVGKSGKKVGISPLEMIKLHGGKAHKVRGMAARGADSMIAVYKDRFTYTFIMNNEVASIHFDNNSKKIFFRGHNIRNMDLTSEQKATLYNVIKILESDSEGNTLKDDYQATLGSQLADNK